MSSATSTAQFDLAIPRWITRLKVWVLEYKIVVIAFAVLLLAAALIRLWTFDRYLPYLDYSDESVPFLVARNWRGLFDDDFVEWRYAGYPPGYVWINIGVQHLVELFAVHPWTVPPDYFFALRLFAAWIGVITVLVVASIGWQLAGPIAAWFAGFIWALAPVITEHNSLATPDPFVYLSCGLAVTMALRAWRTECFVWLSGSLIMGIAAIYLKLWPIHALIPWAIVTLILLRCHPRQIVPWLLVWATLGLIAAAFLFLRIRPLDLPAREVRTFNSAAIENILTPSRHIINFQFAVYPVGMALFAVVIVGSILTYVYSRRRGWRVLDLQKIGLLLLYSISGIVMASTFTQVRLEAGKIRHVLPMSVALLPVWSAALVQIVWTVRRWAQVREFTPQKQLLMPAAVLAVVGVVTLPTFVSGNVALVQRFSLTDMHSILWRWADVNLPMDGMILLHPSSDVAFTWNRPWSGYDGAKPFEWWLELEDEIAASTPQIYVQRGIAYFVMTEVDRTGRFSTPELQDFIEQLTLIKTLPAMPEIRGSTVYIYRMLPPQYTAQATFGDEITLVGYDLSGTEFAPGDTLRLRPYWHAERHPDSNYSMFVHLYPEPEDQLITQHDGTPTTLERPTLTWDDTDELYIGADVNLILPSDIAPSSYRLAVGLYDFNTGERLSIEDDVTYYTIPITIVAD